MGQGLGARARADKRRTQMPHIIEATAPEFGYAACQSVATWRFESPLIKGEPAVVRLQVPVSFKRL